MRSKISNTVTVITGASSGIGRATALRIARQGGHVALASRQEDVLLEVARECQKWGVQALPIKTDVSHEEEVKTLVQKTLKHFGRIDAWVNNAAVTLFGHLENIPSEVYRRVLETNLFGYIYGARAILPHFRERGQGVLVNLASVAGKVGQPFTSAYTTSKFAIVGFSESLRMEMKDTPKIHVCTVLPASIDTPLFQNGANYFGLSAQPVKPVYAPESVARAIIRSIERPKRERAVGFSARFLIALRSIAPGFAEKQVAKMTARHHFKNEEVPDSNGNLFHPLPENAAILGGWNGKDTLRSFVPLGGVLIGLAGYVAYRNLFRIKPTEVQPQFPQEIKRVA